MPDQHWSDVKLLLQFADIEDGSTSFLDQSYPEKTFTVNSTAQVSGGKLVLADSNDYIRALDHVDFELGASDFTLELFRVNFSSTVDDQYIVSKWDAYSPGSNQRSWIFRAYPTSGYLQALVNTSGGSSSGNTVILQATFTPTVGVDYDITLERAGDVWRIYVDGAMVGSATVTAAISDTGANLAVGAGNTKSSGNENGFIGAIDAVRLTVGVARYATDTSYTVPTLPLEWGSGSPPQRRSTQTFSETLLHRHRLRSTQTFTETLYGRSEISTTQSFTEVIVQKARPRSTQTWTEVILQKARLRSTQTWTELLRSVSGVPLPPPTEPETPVERSFAFEVRPVNEDAIFVSIGSKAANDAFFLERVDEFSSDPTDEFVLLSDNRIGLNLVPDRGTKIAITTIGWGGVANDQKVLENRRYSHEDDDWPAGATGPFYLHNPAGLTYEAQNIYAVLDNKRVSISSFEETEEGYYAVRLSEPVGTFGRLQVVVYDTDQFLHVEQNHYTYDGNAIFLDPVPSPTVPIESTLLVWRKITDVDVGSGVAGDAITEEAVGRYVRLTPPQYRFYRSDGDNSIVLREPVAVGDAWVWAGDQQIGAVNAGAAPAAVIPQTERGTISSHASLPPSPSVGDFYVVTDHDGDFGGQWQGQRQPYWTFSPNDVIVYLGGGVWDASHTAQTIFLHQDYSIAEGDFLSIADLSRPFDYVIENGDRLRLPAIGQSTTTGQLMATGDTIRVLSFSHNDNLGIQTERFSGAEEAEYILSQRPWDSHTLWVTVNGRDRVYGMDFTLIDVDPTYDVTAIEQLGYDIGYPTAILKFFEPHTADDVVVATTLANRPHRQPVAFRLYQNNMDEWQYLRISDYHKTHLRYPFRLNDTFLAVEEARKFIPPAYRNQVNIIEFPEPYAVLVENERFEFRKIDLTGDVHLLLDIRRGTGGTSSGIRSETKSVTVAAIAGEVSYSFDFGEDAPLSAGSLELAAFDLQGNLAKEYQPNEFTIDTLGSMVELTLKEPANSVWSLTLTGTLRDWTNPNPIVYDTGTCVVDVGSQQVIPTGYRWVPESIQYSNAAMPVFLREYPGTQYCPETDIEATEPAPPPPPPVGEWGPFWLDTSETDYGMRQHSGNFAPVDGNIHYSTEPVYVWTSYRTIEYAGPTAYGTNAYSNVDWNGDHYVVPGTLVINGVSITMPAAIPGFEEVPGNYFDVAARINQTTAQHGVRATAMPLLEKIAGTFMAYQTGAICTLKLNSTTFIDLSGSDQAVLANLGFADYAQVYAMEPHWSIGSDGDYCSLFALDGNGQTSSEVRIFQKITPRHSGSQDLPAWNMNDVSAEWQLVGSGDFRNNTSYSRFWNWMRQIPNMTPTIYAQPGEIVFGTETSSRSYGLGGLRVELNGDTLTNFHLFPENSSLENIFEFINGTQTPFVETGWTADFDSGPDGSIRLIVGVPQGHQAYMLPSETRPAANTLGITQPPDPWVGRAVHWYYDSVTIPHSFYLVENPAERPDDVKGGIWFVLDDPRPLSLKRFNHNDGTWHDWPCRWSRSIPWSPSPPDEITITYGFYDRGRSAVTDATGLFDLRYFNNETSESGNLSYYVGNTPPDVSG